MNSSAWVRYFRANALHRQEPDWQLPFPEDQATAIRLAKSFSHFQLGESGGGTFLCRAAAQRYGDDSDYEEALILFIEEEREHARLLSKLVERFGGKLIAGHWTHSLFRFFRRALGVRFELQVL